MEICFVTSDTRLLFPIPVIAKIPKCLETILSRFIFASTVLFLSKFPIFTHPLFFGLKISSRSPLLGGMISVPGIGGIAGIIDLPFLKFSKNPKIPI